MRKLFIVILMICLFGCQNVNNDIDKSKEVHETVDAVILKMEDSTLTLAPKDYDRDAHDMFVDDIYTLEVAENVMYWEIFRHIVEKDGVQTVNEKSGEITKEAVEEMLEYGSVYAYLDVNRSREVVKITVWGELIIYE